MLKNKGEPVTVKYNGIELAIEKDGLLDVRDFDISRGQMLPQKDAVQVVERHIMKKYPNQFIITEHTENPMIDAKYREEIAALKKTNSELEAELSKIREAVRKSEAKYSAQAEELNEATGRVGKLKEQVSKLKQDIKDLNEEHEAHVKRMTGGK